MAEPQRDWKLPPGDAFHDKLYPLPARRAEYLFLQRAYSLIYHGDEPIPAPVTDLERGTWL